MRGLGTLALLVIVAIGVIGCTTGQLSQDKTPDGKSFVQKDLVGTVCDRHDQGVKDDASLSLDVKAQYLAESATFRQAFNDQSAKIQPVYQAGLHVIQRYRLYIAKMPTATLDDAIKADRAKRSADAIEEALNAAMGVKTAAVAPDTRAAIPRDPPAAPARLAVYQPAGQ